MRGAILCVVLVAGCGKAASDKSKPDVSAWVIQTSWSGGKPPGTTSELLLKADGSYRATGQTGNRPEVVCESSIPPEQIAPITAALRTTPLTTGVAVEELNGDIATQEIITLGETPYRFPSEKAAPALRTAFANATAYGAQHCK